MLNRISRFTAMALIWLISSLIVVVLAQAMLSPWYLFGVNIDESLPGYLYLVMRDEVPQRNEIAAFRTPANPYYPANIPFIKIIRGVEGDTVQRTERGFFIDGISIGRAKPETRTGLPLTLGPVGTIPKDRYFVWTPHQDSYDSRYGEIGWIASEQLLGRAVRLF